MRGSRLGVSLWPGSPVWYQHPSRLCINDSLPLEVARTRAARKLSITSIRIRYCAALASGRLSDYGKNWLISIPLDSLVNTPEINDR